MSDETAASTTESAQAGTGPSNANPPDTQQDSGTTTPDDAQTGDADDQADDADENDTDTDESGDERGRERKLRRRAQSAERERDALRERVERYQRREVENIAAQRLLDGRDVWASGATLSQMLNDSGDVDPTKVERVVLDLVQSRPHWSKGTIAAAPASQVTFGATKPDTEGEQAPTWKDLLGSARRRG